RHGDGCGGRYPRAVPRRARPLLRARRQRRRPSLGARLRRRFAGGGPRRRRARPRPAAHQYPARHRRGRGARPALSAARAARRQRDRRERPRRRAAPSRAAPGLPRSRAHRRRALRSRRRRARRMLASRHAPGRDHEGDLPRHVRPARRRRLANARRAGAHADPDQALARPAPRDFLMARVHIVGAGLAGLAAAVRLAGAGRDVVLHEASPQAGGRCRSYFDSELGCRIDNGNHLLLSGNHAALAYLARIGAAASLAGPLEPNFAFCDLATGERWSLRPGGGRLPWWIFDARRRVPGTRALDYLRAAALAWATEDDTIAARLDVGSVLFRRLWQFFVVDAATTE